MLSKRAISRCPAGTSPVGTLSLLKQRPSRLIMALILNETRNNHRNIDNHWRYVPNGHPACP